MSPRTTGVVFLLAAALFAFIYFYEIRGEAGRREAEEAEKKLFPDVAAAEIDHIAFTSTDGVAVVLERADRGWELREPLDFPGDDFTVDGMASALADLKSDAVYAEPQPPEVYGLSEGATEIGFRVGDREEQVRIGGKTPLGSNTYVAVGGGDAVYSVPSFTVNALRKTLDAVRDKRVARFDTNVVGRVEVRWRGGGVVLEPGEDGVWRVTAPIEGAADETTVENLLSDLSLLRANGFDDDPPDDAETGLDDPELVLELWGAPAEEGGKALHVRVAIGKVVDGEFRWVRSGTPSLYRIPAERIEDFPRELVPYRFKTLADFEPTDAERVELVFQRLVSTEEGDAPLEVVATRGASGWDSTPERFAPGRMGGLVGELARLRAIDIVAEEMGAQELANLGLAPPNAVVSAFDRDGARLARIHLGVRRGDEGILAQAEGQSAVYLLAPEVADSIPIDLDAFRSDFRSDEQPVAEEGE